MNNSNTPELADTKQDPSPETPSNGKSGPSRAARRSAVDSADGLDPRQLLRVLTAARDGDFSVRLPADMTGIEGKIADVFNEIMLTNQRMADELERMSRVVGKDGKLSERANFGKHGGAWSEMESSVNTLVSDLAWPVAEITRSIDAVAKGDLTQDMGLEVEGRPLKGEFLRSAKIVNTMIGQLNLFTSEVTRVAREVGSEGKLGGQAQVKKASGVWKDLTESVNSMASNLTAQVRNIADVTIAVANGDLSKKITVDVRGEILQLKEAINTMVDQLRSFASEVTRVAREVGTDGKLGGQAIVPGVAGTWKDLTDSVNFMANNLTAQVRNIAEVATAIAKGDLSKKITVDVKGEILELKNTVNTMVDQLNAFASEVTRVAREVGTDGKLGGQAIVPGVAGTWKDLTDNVNSMASNLTAQVRNIADVTIAVANGDLSKKITVDVRGEILQLKEAINTMVDQLRSFAAEVTRVAREVGTEGKLGGQAIVPGVAGTWKDLTDSVNIMAGNLTAQVRNIAEVATAIAQGDLSKKITVDVKGEILELKNTINTMVEQLRSFAAEVTRVAREVGTEGKLGGQAQVPGVAGTWKDLTDNVNSMASNLTGQVRNIAEVTIAVANGDLSKKITVDVRGEILQLKETINLMVEQLRSFAAEVTRVAREVGTEGKLGGQAQVPGVAGTWKDLTDNVNSMASNLTGQVRNIAEVTTAVARGDLSRKITVDVKGEILELKNTINTMVDQLNGFASEVTRVAREVGTEGKLGGQAQVPGVAGTWKDLTDNVNSMASNLTAQVRNIADVTIAVANGDLSKKITVDVRGEILQLKETINLMVEQLRSFAAEVTRVAREVGTEGKLGGQAQVPGVAGTWKDLTDNVNSMASNLTAQVRNIAEVTTAVASGDLSRKITVDVKGEILELKNTINTMVDQLNAFASEVTRVAREVGTEGKLGGQAQVPGVAGTWKDLTDNVNSMASNLTAQVRNIADVTIAVANGDLSKKITVDVRGEILQLKEAINTMVDQLRSFAAEVTRVAREVGTEGKLGGQAQVPGVAGTWKDLTDNVNSMASNLTGQVRNIADVTIAVANGDLSKKITVDARGEILQLKDAINKMVDQLRSFASEVTRVAREVGTEGKLGGQAEVPGVAGTWKDLTDNVNSMAGNLTGQVRNIAEVATAVARGDLSRKVTVDVKGEILELKNTINTMVDQLNAFASEVTRVAREVGTEGTLGGQAQVSGVAGTWKDLTDNVNSMAGNLTGQVRNIAEVATAIANGDLSRKITVPVKGEILELKNTINTMVDQLNAFASEVTRVAREVGTEGKLGGQAQVPGVAGTWKGLTDNVNSMASNLTAQVRNIAEVTTAVARGDLSRKITVDVKGEILELKNTINTMVDQLNAFASEVTRVAREVGTEGKLGGQAQVPGVAGTWKDLTDNVNSMASNLTAQVRNIADVTIAVANGDLSKKITVDVRGEILQLKEAINTMVDQLRSFAAEVTRVAREVGTEGKLGGQAIVPGVAGTWKDLTDSVNVMAGNLTAQVRNIAEVATAIAKGDLSKKITADVKGEILELKNTINVMVDQLNAFAAEATRVAREVGTEGKLGGQAQVPGVAGTWKDLTDSVNVMAANLTDQVRGIVKVVTSVANGNLNQKLTVQAKGEIAALADTINNMTDTLAIFAEQVTTVAREVGVEGRLGGQANVPGASGTWKDLTDNVNLLAANLTTQVRAIAEVGTAVTKGDLTRSIQVIARGEVAELKDNINAMISNLRDTTQRNTEQDWLKTNIAKFTRMLQGQRDLITVGRMLLSELAPLVSAHQGVIYQMESQNDQQYLKLLAGYAHRRRNGQDETMHLGEGLVGQCALEKKTLQLNSVRDHQIEISSGLLEADPVNVVVLPVLFEGETKAVIELASLTTFTQTHMAFLEQLTGSIGIMLNTIEATMRTEGLLQQSQELASELQTRQIELQRTNEELAEKARQLAEQNAEVERKNQEIEQARRAVEEKASELALTSKYKSEFLANMSHELRTPLNSILILGQQLLDNPQGNLTGKQVEYAKTIHSAGTDLLNLISDILDLSKIESGTVTIEAEEVSFASVRDTVDRNFRHVADTRNLGFVLSLDPHLSRQLITDAKRLFQILKNLLSNAFKFTSQGRVTFNVRIAQQGWSADHPVLKRAPAVLAFEVTDTGIGIPPEKQKIIFEAFQQADAGTSRKYGGTGLGLAISRELANLLGGEIKLTSVLGEGSTFTLYLPQTYAGPSIARPADSEAPAMKVLPTASTETVLDDRDNIDEGDTVLLIVEDDPHYARVLLGLARDKGFKGLVAMRGSVALALAREFKPTAISLDIFLPDMLGWTVLSHLKQDPATRHIPVQIITMEEERQHGLERGAFAYLNKPVTTEGLEAALTRIQEFTKPRTKQLLVVDDDPAERSGIIELLSHQDVEITSVGTGNEAWQLMHDRSFDCAVLDLRLPDISGFDLLSKIESEPALRELPIVVFTGKELTPDEEIQLHKIAKSIIIKGVQSPERLLDETALFLHRIVTDLPPNKQRMLERLHQTDEALANKKVLVVDDDVRNIFALTGLLERHSMHVLSASNGREAISLLEQTPDISLVLMDIMMPEMDGYETMQVIRGNPKHKLLPMIALTAKAMKGDREKCLEAGASDYIAKPVNSEQLVSLMRVWLHR
jgi:HAMP domain-containing protein/CheY-like chemotaxis protein/signal transduction histidine kinase